MPAASLWPFALLLGVLAGCGAGGSSPSSREPGDGGAPGCSVELCAPYTCDVRYGTCLTVCTSSAQCTAGHVCEAGLCVGTECTQDTAGARCGGYACVRGKCAPDCALGPCADGFYCRGDTHECVSKCTSRGAPRCGGYVCELEVGECEPYCREGELECASGYVCNSANECTPEASTPP
jgi:hypothetical protein